MGVEHYLYCEAHREVLSVSKLHLVRGSLPDAKAILAYAEDFWRKRGWPALHTDVAKFTEDHADCLIGHWDDFRDECPPFYYAVQGQRFRWRARDNWRCIGADFRWGWWDDRLQALSRVRVPVLKRHGNRKSR